MRILPALGLSIGLFMAAAAPSVGQTASECSLACPRIQAALRHAESWLSSAFRSAAAATKAVDDQLNARLTVWRDQIVERARAEARAVEFRRGLFVYAPAGEDRRAAWISLDDVVTALPPRIVLLVHGLDEPGGVWTDLAPVLAENGYTAVRFDYRNDDSIRACTAELETALRQLKAKGAQQVDIVAHSMGGLVARDVLTREGAYAGQARGHDNLPDVPRLITIGTPNTGSIWAHLAPLSDLREHLARWAEEPSEPRHLLGFLVDGNGHAGDDLIPGSPYLEELNARGLPEQVAITAIVAIMAEVDEQDLSWLESPILTRTLGDRSVQSLKNNILQAASWLGDGVVCLDSAKSVCIADVVEVPANHRTMIRNFEWIAAARRGMGKPAAIPPAIPVILDRLQSE
jgi:pimeloyl-ACP methyl ester carboxylesterase